MNLYKRFCLIVLIVCMAGAAFALEVTGTPPVTGNTTANGLINTEFAKMLAEINDELKNVNSNPEKAIRGFADASVFASQGGTQRAYAGYKSFAFTVGAMAGIRMPKDPFSIAKDPQVIADEMKQKGDVNAGVNVQALNLQLGMNASFLLKDLYLALRFGYFDLANMVDDASFKTLNIGALASYPVIKGKDLALLKWRGITATSGFIIQNTKAEYNYVLDKQVHQIGTYGNLVATPRLVLDMDIKTYVIPLEVNTSILLLRFLNLNLGVGADVAFGRNKTTLGMDSRLDLQAPSLTQTQPGHFTVTGGGETAPSIINPKIMFDLGFKMGPVILDFPVTYYFTGGNGLSVGVTLGAVW